MNRTVLIFLVGCLAAGTAIGYVIGSSGGGDYVIPGETDDSVRYRPAAPRPEEGDPGVVDDSPDRALDRWLSDINVPRSPRGTGVISGRVLTEEGEPVAGVVLRAMFRAKPDKKHRWRRGQGVPEDPELVEFLEEQVKQFLAGQESRREGRTDAEGNYSISGISDDPEGRYYVSAWCRGYELQQRPYIREIKAGVTVNFLAKAILTIPCHVHLPDGSAPEQATVQVFTGRNSRSQVWYADSPEIQLDPGDHQLQATGGENAMYRSEKTSVSVTRTRRPDSIDIHLKDEPGVCGKVEFPPGETNLSVQIGLLALTEGGDPDPQRLLREGKKSWVYVSRPSYLFRDIKAGTWLVGLVFNGQVLLDHRTVQVGKAMVTEDFLVPVPDESQYVLIRLESPKGTAVSDVQFSAGYRAEGYSGSGGSRYQQMPDGRWRVFHYAVREDRKKPGGVYTITARSRTYGTKTVEYDAGSAKSLSIRFEEPAKLRVTVVGYRGSGMEKKIRLEVKRSTKAKSSRSYGYYGSNSSKMDAEGVQTFGPLSPGEYDIHIQVKGARNRWTGADTVPVILKSGENVETVDIPKLHVLTVIADGDFEQASFRLRGKSSGNRYYSDTKKPSGGQVVFENLAAGEYTLQCWGSTNGQMPISIPAQSSVRFEATIFNGQKVNVSDVNGTFVKAGLRQDDILIGVDGEEFTNERTMQAIMTLAIERKNVSLTILRGGRRLTVPVDFSQAWNGKVAGISWEKVAR